MYLEVCRCQVAFNVVAANLLQDVDHRNSVFQVLCDANCTVQIRKRQSYSRRTVPIMPLIAL